MTPEMLERFERLLASGRDDPMLRLTLGQGMIEHGRPAEAAAHLREAVAQNADYTAAWKFLGRALLDTGDAEGAAQAWREGLAVAQRTGDKQLGKEMAVFLKRLGKGRR